VFTLFAIGAIGQTESFTVAALVFATIGIAGYLWAHDNRLRWAMIGTAATLAFGVLTYINWTAYCRNYLATRLDGHADLYPELDVWKFVDTRLPANARVAYTNLYFVYPMQGGLLRRRLMYFPTRAGMKSIADLPWLGNHLPGEAIVPATVQATVAMPDRQAWMKNLEGGGCEYLVVGHGGLIGVPPEEAFADSDPSHFRKVFSATAGDVYTITWNVP
jgi:hypothetical protein